jgi:hypothetical protein
MRRSFRSRLLTSTSLASLCVAAWLLVPGTATASLSSACDKRVNNSPAKLVDCIQIDDLWQHMEAFQAIADANPGPDGHPSRNAGEPGYKASVDYVAGLMRQAGYDVEIQTYQFDYFVFTAIPTMSQVAPAAHDYGLTTEFNPGLSIGTTTADVQPVGGTVLPPTGGSTSGCDPSDFTDFQRGRIALIQRGTCTFAVKVQNAQDAGASGVIVFNEGNTPARSAVFSGSLGDVPTIPVAFTSFDIGNALYNQYQQAVANSTALPRMTLDFRGIHDPNRDDYNVIAESKGGDPNHVLVVDAHLDAIYGAGMLDNASGSATILDIAQKMKNVNPRNKLRFIWFGGEELGLLGSHHYVDNLSPTELSRIRYDLDADVTATPNYIIGVLDPAGVDLFGRTVSTQFPPQVYEPSKVARDQLVDYFDSVGLQHELFSPVGTDAFSFNEAGVPASGVLTGQDCCKSQEEVDMFGGYTGNFEGNIPSFDGGCVDNPFRWCDNLDNNDKNVMTVVSKAFADTTARMAFDTSVIWAGEKRNGKTKVQQAAARGRRGATTR